MSVRPLFKGFALTFILYNCRKRDFDCVLRVYIENFKKQPCIFSKKVHSLYIKGGCKKRILVC